MNNRFFSSLALRNIKSNKTLYIPYLLSSIAIIMMFYLMASLLANQFVQQRSSALPTLFSLGVIVIAIFSVIFILYTNSFVIKKRKKEIGLYGILGLEKRHVAKILLFETMFTSVTSILTGLVAGLVFGRLFFMLLNYLLKLPTDIAYVVAIDPMLWTILLFLAIFAITYIYNVSQFTFSNPIKLLKGKTEGEKEPKGSIILFILALVFLGWGYGISLTIPDPISAISKFFLAVFLVIIGTYLLFISGSIFILKALKKNKRIYYRPGAFISISGMLYRMKQNAVGLANICILASMVIIALSTTLTIFIGSEETLENRYPFENNMSLFGDPEQPELIQQQFTELQAHYLQETEKLGLEVTEMEALRFQSIYGSLDNNRFNFTEAFDGLELNVFGQVIPLEDYNGMTGKTIELAEDEALFYHSTGKYTKEELIIGGRLYQLAPIENDFSSETGLTETIVLVVPDMSHIEGMMAAYQEQFPDAPVVGLSADIGWNTTGTEEEKMAYGDHIRMQSYSVESAHYESRGLQREDWYSTNGGFLFLGIFLGLLFTIGTVLITYFKQVSEGFDDREKFQIMQKVGLDKDMIQDSTKSQIIWMFLLPIVVATIHVIFAYPIVSKLLTLFGITNEKTWLLSFIGVVIAFAAIYWIIYRVTSKVYYSIVK